MESVKEHISRHLLMDVRLQAIALVVGDIVECIYESKTILSQGTMKRKASMLGKKRGIPD